MTILTRAALLAAALALVSAPAAARAPTRHVATITRTANGVPHVRAADWASLGFGTAYAFAEDNVCLLADQLVTLAGERTRWFGADGKVTLTFQEVRNADADAFFQATMDDAELARALRSASPEYRALADGYRAGYNRYLAVTGRDALPAACRGAGWVRPMTAADLGRLQAEKMRLLGSGRFIAGIVGAAPPTAATAANPHARADAPPRSPAPPADADAARLALEAAFPRETGAPTFGSNGWAFGSDATGGPGILLGNPHFPWATTNRFWQVHQTIPGTFDAMGVTLSGLPNLVIGFNRDVAWTHTVSTDMHFTFFELALDPKDPTVYLIDGRRVPMTKHVVRIANADGTSTRRTLYGSIYGPIVVVPAAGLDWTRAHAYAIKDANHVNFRSGDAWLAIARAASVADIRAAITKVVAIPWVNTIAADRGGHALYADVTPTPAVTPATLAGCAAKGAPAALVTRRVYVLDGSRLACNWSADPWAAKPGLLAASAMPQLVRADFVANSNDSYWLANDAAPQTGFAAIVGLSSEPQTLRTRNGLITIRRGLAAHPRSLTPTDVEALIFSNEDHAAALALDEVLGVCRETPEAKASSGKPVALAASCEALAGWDRRLQMDSRGAALWIETWSRLGTPTGHFPANAVVPFDAADPVHTPRGLPLDDAGRAKIRTALADATELLAARGVALDAPWGSVHLAPRGTERIPVHGGPGSQGVMNLQQSTWQDGIGYVPYHGTSYIQVVSFDANGPVADALLSYSQSTDPASPHYADQTRLYSAQRWARLPFAAAAIEKDAVSSSVVRD